MGKPKNTFKKVTPTEKIFSWASSLSIRESNGKLYEQFQKLSFRAR